MSKNEKRRRVNERECNSSRRENSFRDVKSRFNSHGFVTISWQKRINVTIIFCVFAKGNALPQSCENIVCIKICGDDDEPQWFIVSCVNLDYS